MKSLHTIVTTLTNNKSSLFNRYPIKELGIFGSYAREEQDKESDIDILIDFAEPVSMFQFLQLEEQLTQMLGEKVDLVMRSTLKPHIGRNILESYIAL